jgi:hypothetical protein
MQISLTDRGYADETTLPLMAYDARRAYFELLRELFGLFEQPLPLCESEADTAFGLSFEVNGMQYSIYHRLTSDRFQYVEVFNECEIPDGADIRLINERALHHNGGNFLNDSDIYFMRPEMDKLSCCHVFELDVLNIETLLEYFRSPARNIEQLLTEANETAEQDSSRHSPALSHKGLAILAPAVPHENELLFKELVENLRHALPNESIELSHTGRTMSAKLVLREIAFELRYDPHRAPDCYVMRTDYGTSARGFDTELLAGVLRDNCGRSPQRGVIGIDASTGLIVCSSIRKVKDESVKELVKLLYMQAIQAWCSRL